MLLQDRFGRLLQGFQVIPLSFSSRRWWGRGQQCLLCTVQPFSQPPPGSAGHRGRVHDQRAFPPGDGLSLHLCFLLAGLRLLLGGTQRFSTIGHPEALVACYVASWQLRRPDFHRLAVDSLSGHANEWLGRSSPYGATPYYPIPIALLDRQLQAEWIHIKRNALSKALPIPHIRQILLELLCKGWNCCVMRQHPSPVLYLSI